MCVNDYVIQRKPVLCTLHFDTLDGRPGKAPRFCTREHRKEVVRADLALEPSAGWPGGCGTRTDHTSLVILHRRYMGRAELLIKHQSAILLSANRAAERRSKGSGTGLRGAGAHRFAEMFIRPDTAFGVGTLSAPPPPIAKWAVGRFCTQRASGCPVRCVCCRSQWSPDFQSATSRVLRWSSQYSSESSAATSSRRSITSGSCAPAIACRPPTTKHGTPLMPNRWDRRLSVCTASRSSSPAR